MLLLLLIGQPEGDLDSSFARRRNSADLRFGCACSRERAHASSEGRACSRQHGVIPSGQLPFLLFGLLHVLHLMVFRLPLCKKSFSEKECRLPGNSQLPAWLHSGVVAILRMGVP